MASPLTQNITNLQSILDTVNALPEAGSGGVELPELSNPAEASHALSGYEFINQDGEPVTGTFTIDNELNTQDSLIAQIQTALQDKASVSPVLQTKTVTSSTSSQAVTADNGYDGLSQVTVNAIPNTYVKPTATKSATTYTPTTSNQTISAGTYCSGAQTIVGDANLVAENIAEGVSIFGVTGTHSGGGSGGGSVETCTAQIIPGLFVDRFAVYTTVDESGNVAPNIINNFAFVDSITCVCGSVVSLFYAGDLSTYNIACTGAELISRSTHGFAVQITAISGETAYIRVLAQEDIL